MAEGKQGNTKEITIEERLLALFRLQKADSKIDNIQFLRGELPFEVSDLEDEITGLETRIKNYKEEVAVLKKSITAEKNRVSDSKGKIKEYEVKLNEIRNNREFDSLNKEIEYQGLEIELADKHIKEFTKAIDVKKVQITEAETVLGDKKEDLTVRKSELEQIVGETQNEEVDLKKLSDDLSLVIEPRLLQAYLRIRKSVRNGLAVVKVEREACGGCFNKIPPQRQLEIAQRRKVIVCEHCGRVLVDKGFEDEVV
ncbi:MAG: hypothetical protein KAI79_14780 [Bacteroidales bacterium]|nr:hypothetical protein [Bacteroidales bacterium]